MVQLWTELRSGVVDTIVRSAQLPHSAQALEKKSQFEQSPHKFYICPLKRVRLASGTYLDENMSTQQTADSVKDAVQNVADKVKDLSTSDGPRPNLVLDDATGERVSKTELKKRQKAREKDAKKAERESTKQAPPQAKRKAPSQDEEEGKLNANVSQYMIDPMTHLRV